MLDRIRVHAAHNVVGYIAIFVALGGTSYAAIAVPNNSVGNKQLKKDSVDSKKVKNKTLLKDDFKGTLPAGPQGPQGVQGGEGPLGEKGQTGDQGNKGPGGDQGLPGSNLVASQSATSAPVSPTTINATDTTVMTAPALVTTAATRIHATSSLLLSGDGGSAVTCVVKINTNNAGAVAMGQPTTLTFPFFPFSAPSAADGSVNAAAGSHVVTVECQDGSAGAPGVRFVRGDLNVSTAAQ